MNEITHINLGRQAFTIAVTAHQQLRTYLNSIQRAADDPDVVHEVELRMAELLGERGIDRDTVVLPADVDYLIEQLGQPEDFSEDATDQPAVPGDGRTSKRLFRDPDNALIGGVAAGIANYAGIHPAIVRIAFIVLTFISWGIGIVVYLLLWLVVSPARTASEKLQMQGKPVTLEAIKASVDTASLSAASQRFNRSLLTAINTGLRVLIKLAGIGFVVAGLAVLFGVVVTKSYMALHHGKLIQENLFPVGVREQWLLWLILLLAVIFAIFLLLIGIASLKRKWPIRGWITGILVGIFLVASAASLALAADAAPRIRERYETGLHTTAVQHITPFRTVKTTGDIDITYVSAANYAVDFHYFGKPDLSKIKTYIKNDTLYIDSSQLDRAQHCHMLCLFPRYNMTVEVYAPHIEQFKTPPHTDLFYPQQPSMPLRP